jgi:hypothetical protein
MTKQQLQLIDPGEASPPKPKAKRRKRAGHRLPPDPRITDEDYKAMARRLGVQPPVLSRPRSPLERMVDEACGADHR